LRLGLRCAEQQHGCDDTEGTQESAHSVHGGACSLTDFQTQKQNRHLKSQAFELQSPTIVDQ
jgi:hypothetical protein